MHLEASVCHSGPGWGQEEVGKSQASRNRHRPQDPKSQLTVPMLLPFVGTSGPDLSQGWRKPWRARLSCSRHQALAFR